MSIVILEEPKELITEPGNNRRKIKVMIQKDGNRRGKLELDEDYDYKIVKLDVNGDDYDFIKDSDAYVKYFSTNLLYSVTETLDMITSSTE